MTLVNKDYIQFPTFLSVLYMTVFFFFQSHLEEVFFTINENLQKQFHGNQTSIWESW